MDFFTKPPTWLTDQLPPEANNMLQSGGWYGVLGLAGLIVLFIFYRLVRAVLPGPRPNPSPQTQDVLKENLAAYPPLKRAPGARRLTFEGLPVRVRLVVLAPAGTDLDVNPATIPQLLDRVATGLGETAAKDQATTRIWPGQLSHQGFANTFFRNVRRPEEAGEPSNWVLVAGRAKVAKASVLIGLALYADQETTLERRTVEPHEWPALLRIRG